MKKSSSKVRGLQKNPNSYKSKNSQPKIKKDKENCDQNQKIVQNTEQSEVNVVQSKSMEMTKTGIKDEKCHDLQTLFAVKGLSLVARLEGHSKDVTGIVFPSGSNYLYSCSKDKSLRVWDCNSGKCGDVINFDDECATLVEEDPWIFAGLKDMIK
ncbi:hypothetical protein L1987_00858 [Smallanthus sonchifolius]|uniref:Uncharacterized protein n=1 Tax=Smallanthus sonchifolius TaxID=185202 RepID=A0ACB9K3H1_9ASTR|nr:hypothetical protein L1987_00858 [Smallanthus sonchifolius]